MSLGPVVLLVFGVLMVLGGLMGHRAGPCSTPWSTGKITSLPVPARVPWLSKRARLFSTPGFSPR